MNDGIQTPIGDISEFLVSEAHFYSEEYPYDFPPDGWEIKSVFELLAITQVGIDILNGGRAPRLTTWGQLSLAKEGPPVKMRDIVWRDKK